MGVLVVSLNKVSPFFEGWSVYTSEFPALAQIDSKYSRSSLLPHHKQRPYPGSPFLSHRSRPSDSASIVDTDHGSDIGWASPPSTAPTQVRCLAWQGACPSLCLCLPVCLSWMTGRACLSSARRLGVASACTGSRPGTAVTLHEIVLIKLETDPFLRCVQACSREPQRPRRDPGPERFHVAVEGCRC